MGDAARLVASHLVSLVRVRRLSLLEGGARRSSCKAPKRAKSYFSSTSGLEIPTISAAPISIRFYSRIQRSVFETREGEVHNLVSKVV